MKCCTVAYLQPHLRGFAQTSYLRFLPARIPCRPEWRSLPRAPQVQAAMTAEYLQEFYSTVRDKCFAACVTSPGSSLSSSEQKCLSRCMDR